MAGVGRVGDLEIAQDLDFQRREWIAQRTGWVTLALVAVAALLGLFGTGPLSDAAAEQGPLRLGYGRFERQEAATELRVEVAAGNAQQAELRLWLSEAYLDDVRIQRISPEPDHAEAGFKRTVYVFRVGDPNQPAGIRVEFEPTEIGRLSGRLGIVDGQEVEFTQFVYP